MAQIVWFTNNREVVVHFKGIGERSYFTAVLIEFKAVIPAYWSSEDRGWKLAMEDFPELVRFADEQNIRLVWFDHSREPKQLPLF